MPMVSSPASTMISSWPILSHLYSHLLPTALHPSNYFGGNPDIISFWGAFSYPLWQLPISPKIHELLTQCLDRIHKQ